MRWRLMLVITLWSICASARVSNVTDETVSPQVNVLPSAAQEPDLVQSAGATDSETEVSADKHLKTANLLEHGTQKPGPVRGRLGLSLMLGTGLNVCVPRGDASCTDLIPGPFFNVGFEYRFWRMGIGLNYAQGRHFPIGTGAEDVSVSTQHFTFDVLGYFPNWQTFEPFAALGLGFGQIQSRDDVQQSRVEWSSLWQTAHLRAGLRHRMPESWQLHPGWFWTLYGALYLHQGGERCVFYNAQGACRLTEELSGSQTDYASTLELGGQVGFGF